MVSFLSLPRIAESTGVCLRAVLVALVWLAWLAPPAIAQAPAGTLPLIERLTPAVLERVFPGATRVEALNDGGPSAAAAYADAKLVGYVFSTLDVLRAPGYSTTPFDAVAGVTLAGQVTGAAVLFHREPHLLNETYRTGLLVQFLDGMKGIQAKLGTKPALEPSFVSGATISARAMRDAILEGAGLVLRYRSGARIVTEPTLDMLSFQPMSVQELLADGSLARVIVTNADLATAMARAGVAGATPDVRPSARADAVYLDLKAGYATPPVIGRNAGGQRAYQRVTESFPPGSQALIFGSGSDGFYDHRGFTDAANGLRLNRIAVVQGEKTFEFGLSSVINADPLLGRTTTFLVLPPGSGFDPLKPWRADIYAYANRQDGAEQRFLLTSLDYQLPAKHILLPEPPRAPAWMEPWVEGQTEIAILVGALVVLTLILAFQSVLSRSRRAHRWVRNGFLLFTLVWLGWVASAQLSIVNLINYLQAPFSGFGIGFYLAEPLIVIIAVYTAVSLILLGRGVFCGWLCPFGALQELLANLARFLRLPQWNPSERLQSKLWLGKYASLVVVVGLAFLAPDAGAVAEEVEPFKTAITAMFTRGWPYVAYAVGLLSIGLFTERAFCRFLCPLGAALAILDRLHLLDLLKRRPECGSPCTLCERSCPVKAIQRSGRIKMAECFQCLDCQVEYYDDQRCPPLAQERKLRGRAALRPVGAPIPGFARGT
jgi:transcriptional regulator of nitric oxide reductase